jgi:hypothetical protein
MKIYGVDVPCTSRPNGTFQLRFQRSGKDHNLGIFDPSEKLEMAQAYACWMAEHYQLKANRWFDTCEALETELEDRDEIESDRENALDYQEELQVLYGDELQ